MNTWSKSHIPKELLNFSVGNNLTIFSRKNLKKFKISKSFMQGLTGRNILKNAQTMRLQSFIFEKLNHSLDQWLRIRCKEN